MVSARSGWDGVSDFYEEDPDPREMECIKKLLQEPPDAITGQEYDPAEVHTPGEEAEMSEPIRTVGELSDYRPDTPLLVDGYESGFKRAMAETVEVQELDGLGQYHGQYQTPQEAAWQVDQCDWTLMKDGAPPTPVDQPFTAAVLRRVVRDGE